MDSIDILASIITNRCMVQGVVFAEFGPDDFDIKQYRRFPALSHAIIYMVVCKGSMEIVVDNIRYECRPEKNNIVCIKPVNTVYDMSVSPDFRGHVVAYSKKFMNSTEKGEKPVPFIDILALRRLHVMSLGKDGTDILEEQFNIMRRSSYLGSSGLERSIFKYAAMLYHMQVSKMMFDAAGKSVTGRQASRASVICNDFFDLLMQYVEREHDVSFYADRLNISSHYLSRITNRVIGQPAGKVIVNELMSHAYIMLRNPEYTLQQIADRLNFSDQSSFGKFFRKHAGMSPAAYRKEQ